MNKARLKMSVIKYIRNCINATKNIQTGVNYNTGRCANFFQFRVRMRFCKKGRE